MPTLEKRLKRQVIGKTHLCFAATAPGLEKLCARELGHLETETIGGIESVPGGVEFHARLHDIYAINLHLRTATRILLRLVEFKATNFRDLERRTREIPWELYFGSNECPEFVVTAKRSRLFHTDAIAERMGREIAERLARFGTAGPPTDRPQTIHARAVDDRFLISIDTSGEPLYKRGIKTSGARAPIRETLASAVLLHAGYTGREFLLDPMCGSGTFSIEAAMMATNRAPGLSRTFAFFGWPSFRKKRWEHLCATARGAVAKPVASILATDRDSEACRRLEAVIEKNREDFAEPVQVREVDFFSLSPAELTETPGVLVLNPPYGRRIGSPSSTQSLYPLIRDRLLEEYRGWKFGILLPKSRHLSLFAFAEAQHRIHHGGLELALVTGRIPEG